MTAQLLLPNITADSGTPFSGSSVASAVTPVPNLPPLYMETKREISSISCQVNAIIQYNNNDGYSSFAGQDITVDSLFNLFLNGHLVFSDSEEVTLRYSSTSANFFYCSVMYSIYSDLINKIEYSNLDSLSYQLVISGFPLDVIADRNDGTTTLYPVWYLGRLVFSTSNGALIYKDK